MTQRTNKLHWIMGAFDGYGAVQYKLIFIEPDGTLSQLHPNHVDLFLRLHHKRWRWWVQEQRLDHPALMDWVPDVEELDRIQQIAKQFPPDGRGYGVVRYPYRELDGTLSPKLDPLP